MTYTYDGIAGGPHAVTNLSDGTTFTYDDNGNMLTMQKGSDLTQYVYDVENHLIQVKKNRSVSALPLGFDQVVKICLIPAKGQLSLNTRDPSAAPQDDQQ